MPLYPFYGQLFCSQPSREAKLPNLDLEQYLIRVIVTPPEVAPLLGRFHLPELMVFPVLLAEVNAVRIKKRRMSIISYLSTGHVTGPFLVLRS